MAERLELQLAIRGSLRKMMAADIEAGKTATTNKTKSKVNAIKNNLRRQVKRAGLGSRLANTVRGVTEPSRRGVKSMNASGLVFSTALVKGKRGGRVDLITVFAEGATVGPRRGRFLAVPTPEAQQAFARRIPGRRETLQPSDFPRDALIPIGSDQGSPRLVLRGDPDTVVFVLVPSVRIRPRIDVAKAARLADNLDQQIAQDWERRSQRAFDRLTSQERSRR